MQKMCHAGISNAMTECHCNDKMIARSTKTLGWQDAMDMHDSATQIVLYSYTQWESKSCRCQVKPTSAKIDGWNLLIEVSPWNHQPCHLDLPSVYTQLSRCLRPACRAGYHPCSAKIPSQLIPSDFWDSGFHASGILLPHLRMSAYKLVNQFAKPSSTVPGHVLWKETMTSRIPTLFPLPKEPIWVRSRLKTFASIENSDSIPLSQMAWNLLQNS